MSYGYLAPNSYVNVVSSGGYIQILPIEPNVLYVPYYDPLVVFAPPRPGFAIAGAIRFGPGITIGAAFGGWGWWLGSGFVWPSHTILIDRRPWGRGVIGLFTCIHMCIRGCVRLDRVWRCIGSNDNYSVASLALPADAGRGVHAANGSIRANLRATVRFLSMLPRWSNVLHQVTTAGPYANERLSIVVLTSVIVAGIAAVAYADNAVTSFSLVSLLFLAPGSERAGTSASHQRCAFLCLSDAARPSESPCGILASGTSSEMLRLCLDMSSLSLSRISLARSGGDWRISPQNNATSLWLKFIWVQKCNRAFCLALSPL